MLCEHQDFDGRVKQEESVGQCLDSPSSTRTTSFSIMLSKPPNMYSALKQRNVPFNEGSLSWQILLQSLFSRWGGGWKGGVQCKAKWPNKWTEHHTNHQTSRMNKENNTSTNQTNNKTTNQINQTTNNQQIKQSDYLRWAHLSLPRRENNESNKWINRQSNKQKTLQLCSMYSLSNLYFWHLWNQ